MKPTKILDGACFWAPNEGLITAANLLKLAVAWIESDDFHPVDCPPDQAKDVLQGLEAKLRILEVRCKPVVAASVNVNSSKPVSFTADTPQTISQTRAFLVQLREAIANSHGALILVDLGIDYLEHSVQFTQNSYFEFALRSLDEILHLVKHGVLLGMQPEQFCQPVQRPAHEYFKRRVA